jgi:membrane protein DedA with SNARE-associated domain
MLKSLIASLKSWYVGALTKGGYAVVALMMAIESSIFPLPSEVVIPPAAYWAHTKQIPLSLAGIIIAGTIGSWLGATAMYWAARWAGRPLVLRFGPYVMISQSKVEGAERWATHYGSMGIFISRLLPVVRHLIGIPAGIVRMNYKTFSLYTLLGSGIWCGVLCWIGIKAGNDENLMKGEMHAITLWLGGAMLALGALYYFFVHRQMKAAAAPSPTRVRPRDG